MSVDEILLQIGELGAQQWKYVVALSVVHTHFPMHMLQYTFAGRTVAYECNGNGGNGSVAVSAHGDCPEGCAARSFGSEETSIVSEWDLECER